MPKASILLLDDDVETLIALEKFLRKQGYKITSAAWPTDAVDLISRCQSPFDMLITDLRMPGIHGFTLLRAVRQSRPRLFVVVLTAFASLDTRKAAAEFGAIAVLEKPVNTKELIETITRALRRPEERGGGASLG